MRAVEAGRSVLLDYGPWLCNEREDCKGLLKDAGGRWRLLCSPGDRVEPPRRQDANALTGRRCGRQVHRPV